MLVDVAFEIALEQYVRGFGGLGDLGRVGWERQPPSYPFRPITVP